VESMVDVVVAGYRSGFNRSLHNYSQILKLFNESKAQLLDLRGSLEAAKRRLSAQSRYGHACGAPIFPCIY
jgi:exocyst complex component 4